jgi:hypothetical protein
MQLIVHSIISRYVLCAKVVHSGAMLRFRFERPLDLKHVSPGRSITVLECEFSRLTHTVNCRRVQESDVLQAEPVGRPCVV